MRTGLSTALFIQETLTIGRIQSIYSSGFDLLELFAMKPHFDYQDKALCRAVGSWLSDKGSFLHSIHTPFLRDYQARKNGERLSLADLSKPKREQAVDEIRRSLELAELVSFPYAIVHMGASREPFDPRQLDAMVAGMETLVPFAADRGATLLLENIPNELSTMERMLHFLDEAKLAQVGICFDIGHAHMRADVLTELQAGRKRILSTHIHDNNGQTDEHLYPFDGTIPWEKVFETFAGIGYQGCLMLELHETGRDPLLELVEAIKIADRFKRIEEKIQQQQLEDDNTR